ncbi:pyridoxamine 5'-phosphate oxidase family protein [Streptomyces kanasensis]|uniref:pyridoxamine 5'-phosphate oxidase family protein n=1 Tax=Streptomyces kanasensis TaxID=936756 RepID=UPI0038028A49
MQTTEPPRAPEDRRRDVLARLRTERDVWVASAGGSGLPYLVPLWFLWDGEAVWLATRATNPTAGNLRDHGRARLALGDTYDVVLVDGTVEVFGAGDVPPAAADAYAARHGWDPRREPRAYAYLRVLPHAVQAWRGEHELAGRHLLRDGERLGGGEGPGGGGRPDKDEGGGRG